MRNRHRLELLHDSGKLEVASGAGKSEASKFALHVSPGDQVEFHCHHGNFGIHFRKDSPFEEKEYLANARQPIVATVRADAAPGRYKHDVSIVLKEDRRYWDPEIIVD